MNRNCDVIVWSSREAQRRPSLRTGAAGVAISSTLRDCRDAALLAMTDAVALVLNDESASELPVCLVLESAQ